MSQTGFYLLFIPGLTIVSASLGTLVAIFAFNQGEFQAATKKGLFSLVVVVLLLAVLGLLAFNFDHLNLPRPGA
jgi:hypothetical protein